MMLRRSPRRDILRSAIGSGNVDRSLVQNVANIYAAYLLRFVSPLLVVPYLARCLGPAHYGLVLLGGALGLFVTLITEYGFPSSAAREIASAESDDQARHHSSSTVAAKIVMILPAACVGLVSATFVPALLHDPIYGLGGASVGVAMAFNTTWFWQGRERLAKSTALDLLASLTYAALVLVFIQAEADAPKVLFCQAAAYSLSAVVGHYLIYESVGLSVPRLRAILRALASSTSLFLARAAVSLYTTASVLLIGALCSGREVSYYSSGEKLIIIFLAALYPLGQAIFPRVARNAHSAGSETKDLVRALTRFNAGLGLTAAVVTTLAGKLMMNVLYGHRFDAGVKPFVILGWMLPFAALNQVLGTQILIPNRRDRQVTVVVLSGGLINLLFAFLLTPRFGAIGMATSRCISEAAVCGLYILAAQRSNLLSWVFQPKALPN